MTRDLLRISSWTWQKHWPNTKSIISFRGLPLSTVIKALPRLLYAQGPVKEELPDSKLKALHLVLLRLPAKFPNVLRKLQLQLVLHLAAKLLLSSSRLLWLLQFQLPPNHLYHHWHRLGFPLSNAPSGSSSQILTISCLPYLRHLPSLLLHVSCITHSLSKFVISSILATNS